MPVAYESIDYLLQQRRVGKITPESADKIEAGFFEGAVDTLEAGALSAVKKIAQPTVDVIGALSQAASEIEQDPTLTMQENEARVWARVAELRSEKGDDIDALIPDPRKVGTLGQLLFGVVDMGGRFAAGLPLGPFGGALMLGGTEQVDVARKQKKAGVDPVTAEVQGVIAGGLASAGAGLPGALGKSALTKVASGVAINTTFGVVSRGSQSAWLGSRGYDDAAKAYDAFNKEDLLIDAVLGAAFPTIEMGARNLSRVARGRYGISRFRDNTTPGAAAITLDGLADASKAASDAVDAIVAGRQPIGAKETLAKHTYMPPERSAFTPELSEELLVESLQDLGLPELEARMQAAGDRAGLGRIDLPDETYSSVDPVGIDALTPGVQRSDYVWVGNAKQEVDYKVFSAADLIADIERTDTQFRDRTRAASEMQIMKIAREINPEWLGDNIFIDRGAPTLLPDGRVLAGNGRILGVQMAYEAKNAAKYKEFVGQWAKERGIDVAGVKDPVLVRVMRNAPDDVREAAIASNESAGLAMSDLELSKTDAKRLGSVAEADLKADNFLLTQENMPVFKKWVESLPPEQRGNVMDANGRPSQSGLYRIRNALMYKAYGDSPIMGRLVESLDEGLRNVGNALREAAPMVASYKDAVEAGRMKSLGLEDVIVKASDRLIEARKRGVSAKDVLDQADMMDGDDLWKSAFKFMNDNIRSGRALKELLENYYTLAREAGDARQGSLLGGSEPDRADLFKRAIERTTGDIEQRRAEIAAKASKATQRTLDEIPDALIPDENGNPVNAADHIQKKANELVEAEKSEAMYKAASECFAGGLL